MQEQHPKPVVFVFETQTKSGYFVQTFFRHVPAENADRAQQEYEKAAKILGLRVSRI